MLLQPAEQLGILDGTEVQRRLSHVAQEQIQASQQGHRIQIGWSQLAQLIPGLLERLRLTPREAHCREGQNRQTARFERAIGIPTVEQIDLLLNREEASDLLKERFEIRLVQ